MDKASILGDTIEYVKQLRRRVQELESLAKKNNHKGERSGPTSGREKRKMRIVEEDGVGGSVDGKVNVVESPPRTVAAGEVVQVEVSIIESDALVEIECVRKEGVLLDVLQMLAKYGIEVTTVQSSTNNGVFAAQLRAKVLFISENYDKSRGIIESSLTIFDDRAEVYRAL